MFLPLRTEHLIIAIYMGAEALDVPILWAEQNPDGLGPTVPEIVDVMPGEPITKFSFSCCGEARFVRALEGLGRRQALLCGAGVLAWALAAALATGDPLWLWHHVVTGEENLYGAASFWHYPRGLVFIIGPVAFLFLLVDLVDRLVHRRIDALTASILVALALYVALAWKLPFGHSAGFLRHLVAIANSFHVD